jgi:hypothetical protein
MTDAQLEAFARELIQSGNETDKVELKSSFDFSIRKDRLRLVKLIAAIANSDSPHFDNKGYIILGAKRALLVGGFSALEKDSTSSDIRAWVTNYVEPDISFSVHRFQDNTVGSWGVIVIPPSSETHIIKIDFRDDKLSIRKGDIYVRHGDTISLADRADLDRLQSRKLKIALDGFKREIGALRQEVIDLKGAKPDLKLYLLDQNDNHHESLVVQPVLWKKTEEQRKAEMLNEGRIRSIEKELEDLNHKLITTSNTKRFSAVSKKLRDELGRLKTLRYDYYRNDPLQSRIIELRFILNNNGSSTAKGINLYIYFPTSVEVSETRKAFLKEIENPSQEQLTRFVTSIATSGSYRFPQYANHVPNPDFVSPRSGGPEIAKTDTQYTAKYWAEKLMQSHGLSLSPIYLLSPETELDLPIEYGIYVENSPGATVATLQLSIRPKAKD